MLDFFFFFNDTATTEIYTLSLHDALPIFALENGKLLRHGGRAVGEGVCHPGDRAADGELTQEPQPAQVQHPRSEEHTSELQSRQYLVCRLLLEKKNTHPPYSCLSSM